MGLNKPFHCISYEMKVLMTANCYTINQKLFWVESDFLYNIWLVMQHWYSTITVGFDRILWMFLLDKQDFSYCYVCDKLLYLKIFHSKSTICSTHWDPHAVLRACNIVYRCCWCTEWLYTYSMGNTLLVVVWFLANRDIKCDCSLH